MRKISYLILGVFVGIITAGAQDTSIPVKTGTTSAPPEQINKYPFCIYKKIHDPAIQNNLVSVLVKGDLESIKAEVKDLGGVFKYAAGDIACVRIPVNKINVLAEKKFVVRIEGSDQKIELLNDRMILNNNVYLVQQGVNLPQAYNGEGVVVGIIDEGIDFHHPDLKDELGHTRIKWLWDQRLSIDPNYTPQPYGYGQNFTNSEIDNYKAEAVIDHGFSHGTHVTGTAAGNGLAVNNYKGVAPKADIVFVAVNENTSDDNFLTNMVDAVNYIFNKADSLHEPCAINISMGTYFGSHDALDNQAQLIGSFISQKNGRFIACAAGNAGPDAGEAPIHLHTKITNDTSFTWLGGYSNTQLLIFQLWADSANFKNVAWMIGADKTAPDFDYRGGTTFQPGTSLGHNIVGIYNGLNRIGRVETYIDSSFGRYSIECAIAPDSANYRWRLMTRGTGEFDAWSFDFVHGGVPDSSVYPVVTKYKYPDADQSIVSSFTCSPKVVTVGNYINRNSYTDMTGVIQRDTSIVVGKLAGSSSHGPTRDGRIKPDIAATGAWVLSCAARYDLNDLFTYQPYYVAAGQWHRLGSGTSMASPVVAGTAALYLQKNPNATYQEIKDAIIGCSKTDQFTGSSLPNSLWGYGKLDAYKVLTGCSSVGVNETVEYSNVFFENYPNPFSEQTTIHYNLMYAGKQSGSAYVALTDALGRKVRDIAITGLEGNIVINKSEISSGVYFYSLVLDGKIIRTNKLVVM